MDAEHVDGPEVRGEGIGDEVRASLGLAEVTAFPGLVVQRSRLSHLENGKPRGDEELTTKIHVPTGEALAESALDAAVRFLEEHQVGLQLHHLRCDGGRTVVAEVDVVADQADGPWGAGRPAIAPQTQPETEQGEQGEEDRWQLQHEPAPPGPLPGDSEDDGRREEKSDRRGAPPAAATSLHRRTAERATPGASQPGRPPPPPSRS